MSTESNGRPVYIQMVDAQNVKRLKAVRLAVNGTSLTVIGGGNGQGKTSVLDAIAWTLGGDRFRPSNPIRDGEDKLATRIELSNGLVVERRGSTGALRVTDPEGGRGGQQLLNEFVNGMALNLSKFMAASAGEKAQMLLDLFPELGAELQRLNEEAKRIYDERHAMGQIADRKAKHAADLPFHEDVPDRPLSGSEMTSELEAALARNARNRDMRENADAMQRRLDQMNREVRQQDERIAELEKRLQDERARRVELIDASQQMTDDVRAAEEAAKGLADADTSEIKRKLEEIDAINARVRQNMDKAKAEADAQDLQEQYRSMTTELEKVRAERVKLLGQVQMPMDGLLISEDGALLYRDQEWDCMSSTEQLRVAVAICSAMRPECGFVLLDGLERMDIGQLRELGAWLAERKLQAIGTRVSTGEECTLIIEDGEVAEIRQQPAAVADGGSYDFG